MAEEESKVKGNEDVIKTKYDLDFKSLRDVLKRVLGIVDPTNLDSLKSQLEDIYYQLSKAYEDRYEYEIKTKESELEALASEDLQDAGPAKTQEAQEKIETVKKEISDLREKLETHRRNKEREVEIIRKKSDCNKALKSCIFNRLSIIQSLEAKPMPGDTEEQIAEKERKRAEAALIYSLSDKVPSFVDFIEKRDELLEHIDVDDRIVKFPKNFDEKDSERTSKYPVHKLYIMFSRPEFPREYKKVFEKAGIYAFRFGYVAHLTFPNEKTGRYSQEHCRKELIGITKKDEFGELKRYTVMMDSFSTRVPPEFYRDVLFSDMVLRNAENNLGYIGGPKEDREDKKYGYRVGFEGIGLTDFLRAIYLEDKNNVVSVESNYIRDSKFPDGINSVKSAFQMINLEMGNGLKNLFNRGNNGGKDGVSRPEDDGR